MNQATTGPVVMSCEGKVQGRHFERLAVVYVRQSTVQQVVRHQESTRHQYSLVQLAEQFGWPRERILVIDDDQGISGASAEKRLGFQRLLSEVALDHVGLILGVEMSRLARSCKDWYQLLEICALFGTLICDQDGLYDPSQYNDRLLLGLKGTMSEAELHILQQRMRQGALQKARRGELVSMVPRGYVRDASGEVRLDPDEQVRGIVRLVFEQFARLGSISGVLRHLVDHGLQLPRRAVSGPQKGELTWLRPSRSILQKMLTHPMYAGAYVYGRHCKSPDVRRRRRVPVLVPRHEWHVLLRDRYPAYVSWEEYERNIAKIKENHSRYTARGSVRKGRALLTGLVTCGRCGHRLGTRYAERDQPRYFCLAERTMHGGPACQSFAARALDDEVVRLALLALTPSALEVSLRVAMDLQGQREQADIQWRQRLERAAYEADRIRRQYEAVEPENRLVARTLEAAWEEKLCMHRELVEKHERFLHDRPAGLTVREQERLKSLANDVPTLWNSATTTDADRKQILRELIDKVVVNVEAETEWVESRIYWAGGHETYTRFRRPVARLEQLASWPECCRRMQELNRQARSAPEIVSVLNREGYRSVNGKLLTESTIRSWLSRYGLSSIHRQKRELLKLGPDEWFTKDLCRKLGVSIDAVYRWIRQRLVTARQIDGRQGWWVVTANADKLQELTAFKTRQDERRRYHESSSEDANV